MRDITLLHIGDVHYKGIIKEEPTVDKKDKSFPSHLTEKVSPIGSYSVILECLIKEIDNSTLALLMSGDLSTYGNIDSYRDCLVFLGKITKKFFCNGSPEKLYIVPGNHDINWDLICPESELPKFEKINEVLKAENFPTISLENPLTEKIHEDRSDGSVLIFAVNSCIGCGEKRYYPEEIREILSKFYAQNKTENKEDKDEDNYFCDILDTPMVQDQDLMHILKSIKSNPNCLPVILTHHNLLPQKMPRLAMYTELLNSGSIRQKLLSVNKPVLYLHGHIHDDPIEIIQSPSNENARVICISAPLLFPNTVDNTAKKFGFNKIKIIFGSGSVPIGCKITFFRLVDGEIAQKERKISFFDPSMAIALITDEEKTILNIVNESGEKILYLGDIEKIFNKITGRISKLEEIERAVDRLGLLGLIRYDDKETYYIRLRIAQKKVFS